MKMKILADFQIYIRVPLRLIRKDTSLYGIIEKTASHDITSYDMLSQN